MTNEEVLDLIDDLDKCDYEVTDFEAGFIENIKQLDAIGAPINLTRKQMIVLHAMKRKYL